MTRRKSNLSLEESKPLSKKDIINKIVTKKSKDKFLTDNQKKYYDNYYI